MRLRCKAGDLAIITKDYPDCQANIGRFVRVSGPIVVRKRMGATWLITPLGVSEWKVLRSWDERYYVVVTARTPKELTGIEHPDKWMVPLRDPKAARSTARSKATSAGAKGQAEKV